VQSGHGGAGSVSFRREKFVPRGGPDGGDGGRGGDVVFKVNSQLGSLLDLKYKRKLFAENGHPGSAVLCSGSNGASIVIQVPPGTILKNEETGQTLKELNEPGEEFVFLKGGRGGKGNAFFKNSVNQAPHYAQPGEPGEAMQLKLELKLLADVGIIGYPNAGKSTLISRISAAKPKVADYPFTTLVPNLGVVRIAEGRSAVVADIPGLIPGAHEGVGLGIRFLRHIERTKGFVHLIDVSGFSGRDPVQDFKDINYELEMYDRDHYESHEGLGSRLSSRPQIVVLNKIDALNAEDLAQLKKKIKIELKMEPMAISAVTGHGTKELIHEIGRLIEQDSEKTDDETHDQTSSEKNI